MSPVGVVGLDGQSLFQKFIRELNRTFYVGSGFPGRIFIGSFAYNIKNFLRKHFDDACSEVVFNFEWRASSLGY